jgi:MipA family protein
MGSCRAHLAASGHDRVCLRIGASPGPAGPTPVYSRRLDRHDRRASEGGACLRRRGQVRRHALPVFGLRRAGKTARFRAPLDGPAISLIEAGGFHFGPTGKFRKARKADDSDQLRGLGDVDWTVEVGAFAEFWPSDWFRTRAEIRRGFGGHEGIVADLSADAVIPFNERWTLSGGPRASFADTKATVPYFGIDATQSLLSGLPAFNAKGGLHSVGAGLQAIYQWTPQWEVRSYVEYSHLMGDAASSPLVATRGSRDQLTFGVGVSYSFDIKLW